MTITTLLQEDIPADAPAEEQENSDPIFAAIGIFMVMLLIWFGLKGKLRDWFLK